MSKFKSRRFQALLATFLMACALVVPTGVAAAQNVGAPPVLNHFALASKEQACDALGAFGDRKCDDGAQDGIGKIVRGIVNIVSLIAGFLAIIFIIVAGARFITANGDSSKVGAARNALLYAIIGIIVIALAQIIVHFTVNRAQATQTACKWDAKLAVSDTDCKKPN